MGYEAVYQHLEELGRSNPGATDFYLISGKFMHRFGKHQEAIRMFEKVKGLAIRGALSWRHPWTAHLALAQLALERSQLPCSRTAEANLRENLLALRELDADLADEIAGLEDSKHLRAIDVWGQLMLGGLLTRRIAVLQEDFIESVKELLPTRAPVAFFGIGSGQEILHLLRHPPQLPLGETRVHYLFEKEVPALKEFLRIADVSAPLRERRLIIFSGKNWPSTLKRLFSTGRFPSPKVSIGDQTPYRAEVEGISQLANARPEVEKNILDYYRSGSFKNRLQEIAAGREKPRALLLSCRWTTVLKHVGADFQWGFEKLGCQTEMVLENSDVESLSKGAYFEALGRLQPDFIFHVSHARPSCNRLPPELPILCFFMDRCGPILNLPDLGPHIQPLDLFFCIFREFVSYLQKKGVPREQLILMPTPGDEEIFHPLDPADPRLEKFAAEVSLVKHGGPDADRCFEQFVEKQFSDANHAFQKTARGIFEGIHRLAMENRARHWFEDEILELAIRQLPGGAPSPWQEGIKALTTEYMVTVYSASYRQHFLEPLARSGLRLHLYGLGWDSHPLLAPFSRGPIGEKEILNAVYQASAINLHIHHEASMHQRLVEGALAGGFFLVNRLNPLKNWQPLDPFFEEGREVALFDSARDLLEKCRHYLAHPDERRAMALRMRERALKEHTVKRAAQAMLQSFRERLSRICPR
ncbi:MAG: glycosyltransferase family 1 protein [Planctomycetes bacterium]|nr:glycosyltransferase family 1 protein [Planctomycetota bacterium]